MFRNLDDISCDRENLLSRTHSLETFTVVANCQCRRYSNRLGSAEGCVCMCWRVVRGERAHQITRTSRSGADAVKGSRAAASATSPAGWRRFVVHDGDHISVGRCRPRHPALPRLRFLVRLFQHRCRHEHESAAYINPGLILVTLHGTLHKIPDGK